MNGLDINESQFNKMNPASQRTVLFQNIKYLRLSNKDNPWVIRVGFIWLFVLSVILGFKKYLPI